MPHLTCSSAPESIFNATALCNPRLVSECGGFRVLIDSILDPDLADLAPQNTLTVRTRR